MSVEARESMTEAWTRWQGHVINGVFPLGRHLGCSDHSGVFLTKSAARYPGEIAIKLVPTGRALAESQLPRWKRAGSLIHSRLLRLFEWGGCQLDGLPYLYLVMEYADQTLAQLLPRRALTEDEAREMLLPMLEALAFVHDRQLVLGQLKPANILVVGDQLKLASDTIRRGNEGTMGSPLTVYDPPEARHGNVSTAADVWALGVTLLEALSRRAPARFSEHRDAIALPPDFSPAFRDVVARCLSPEPQDRPSVAELESWARGRIAELAPPPTRTARPAVLIPPSAPRTREPRAARSPRLKPRVSLPMLLGAVVALALGWIGVRGLMTHRAPAPVVGTITRAAADVPAPTSTVSATNAASATKSVGSDPAASGAALHEVIPDVPRSARRTIRGHIKVWVRVIVGEDGAVLAAAADRAGPSRYFERLALEAARKWTFPRADTPPPRADSPSRRLMQVRFDFSRDGTTGRAVTVR